MLDKPNISEPLMAACLLEHYGLAAAKIVFLPIGADENTAVYHLVADHRAPYFLKVRSGDFDETSATLPKFLADQGIKQIIAPIETIKQQLWASFDRYNLVLYPFIEGRSGFDVELSDRNWVDLGIVLRAIHDAILPSTIMLRLRRETYPSQWRDMVKTFLARNEVPFVDSPAAKLAAFLRTRHEEILKLVERAEQLALVLQTQTPEFVLCHADIHAGNVLIDMKDDLYIVDWDTAVLAVKERDLMFVGAGVGGTWSDPKDEAPFYQGYGQTKTDPLALAYYRYERIVEDIAVMCQQMFSKGVGHKDSEEGFRQLTSQFLPNHVVEMAYQMEDRLPPGHRYSQRSI
jgi:spectinomycin phosphotransferase